jgi:hypothetical protein
MAKLNKLAYDRLLLQAEEAKELGLHSLSRGMFFALKSAAEDADKEVEEYSYEDLKDEMYQELWELASKVAQYYDVENMNAEKVNEVLEEMREEFIDRIEEALDIKDQVLGAREPKVPGETK